MRLIAPASIIVTILFLLSGYGFYPLKAEIYKPHTTLLSNGLEVIIVPIHRAPVAVQFLFYKVGGMDDPVGKSGLAHLLEHMMFKGTKRFPDGRFSSNVADIGGRDNAYTSHDVTAYYQMVPSHSIEMVMEMEADRMRNLNFADDDFAESFLKERDVVIEERAQRTDNKPEARLMEQSDPAFYLNHPYRKPIIGWPGELESLTLDDAKQFYDRYYHPQNALLIIIGDVEPQEMFAMVEQYYGKIDKGKPITRPHHGKASLQILSKTTLEDTQVSLPRLSLRFPIQGYGQTPQPEYEDLLALSMGVEMLASGASSPLYQALVIDQAKAVAVGGYSHLHRRGPAEFGFYMLPAQGISVDEAEALLLQNLYRLEETALDDALLQRIKHRLLNEIDFALDDLQSAARAIGHARMLGIPLHAIERQKQAIEAMDLDSIKSALAYYLHQSGRQIQRLRKPTNPPSTIKAAS